MTGFVLKAQQLPRALSSPDAAVLYTLHDADTAGQAVTPNATAAAAACIRNAACVMFTSDGFLIGVYRAAKRLLDYNAAIAREQQGGGPLLWVPMQYCAGRCCGTWVADGLEQQLLTPAANDSSVGVASSVDLNIDDTAIHVYSFNAGVMARFCALTNASSVAPAQAIQQQQCPRRCKVACCAKFANGSMNFDGHNDFEQCAPNPCAHGCSSPSGVIAAAVGTPHALEPPAVPGNFTMAAAAVSSDVLKRQYLRAASAVEANSSMGTGASGAVTMAGSLN
jgi:hypothetical protein